MKVAKEFIERGMNIYVEMSEEVDDKLVKYIMRDSTLCDHVIMSTRAVKQLADQVKLCCLNPARFLGISDTRCMIKEGYSADLGMTIRIDCTLNCLTSNFEFQLFGRRR